MLNLITPDLTEEQIEDAADALDAFLDEWDEAGGDPTAMLKAMADLLREIVLVASDPVH